jgi:cell division septum initiation protein DivIVA
MLNDELIIEEIEQYIKIIEDLRKENESLKRKIELLENEADISEDNYHFACTSACDNLFENSGDDEDFRDESY